MGRVKRVRGLDTAEELAARKREWTVERVGWRAMVLVVILTMPGRFGCGLSSTLIAGDAGRSLAMTCDWCLRQCAVAPWTDRDGC